MRKITKFFIISTFFILFLLPIITVSPYIGGNSTLIDPKAYASDGGFGGGSPFGGWSGSGGSPSEGAGGGGSMNAGSQVASDFVVASSSVPASGISDGTDNINYQEYMKNISSGFEPASVPAKQTAQEEFKNTTTAELSKSVNESPKTPLRKIGYRRGTVLDIEEGD